MLILYSSTLLNLFISANIIAFSPFFVGSLGIHRGCFLGCNPMSQVGNALHTFLPQGRTQEGVCWRKEQKISQGFRLELNWDLNTCETGWPWGKLSALDINLHSPSPKEMTQIQQWQALLGIPYSLERVQLCWNCSGIKILDKVVMWLRTKIVNFACELGRNC